MAKRGDGKASERPWVVGSLSLVAEFFGISETTVRKEWRAAGVVPRSGPYDLSAIYAARRERDRQNELRGNTGRSETSELLADKVERQVMKLESEIARITRENEVASGNLLRKQDVERRIVQWAVKFRSPLMALADQISSRVPGSMKSAVKHEVTEVVRSALVMVRDLTVTDRNVEKLILDEADRIRGGE